MSVCVPEQGENAAAHGFALGAEQTEENFSTIVSQARVRDRVRVRASTRAACRMPLQCTKALRIYAEHRALLLPGSAAREALDDKTNLGRLHELPSGEKDGLLLWTQAPVVPSHPRDAP